MQDEAYMTAQGATLIFILHGTHLSKYKQPHKPRPFCLNLSQVPMAQSRGKTELLRERCRKGRREEHLSSDGI